MSKDITEELVESLEHYIKLLEEELDELIPLAVIRFGWESSRVEAGIEARERIEKAKSAREDQ